MTRVASNDWDNLMETVTLYRSYSEEIKNEVWIAIENMEDFSNPWVVVKIRDGKASAKVFTNKIWRKNTSHDHEKGSRSMNHIFVKRQPIKADGNIEQ